MNKNLAMAISLILFMLLSTFSGSVINAQSVGYIIINADGSVTGANSIHQVGNTYTLTANITGNIEVQKSNVVVNGAGYTLNGKGSFGIDLNDPNSYPTLPVSNVTIENLYITNCGNGIISNGGSNFTFYDDYLSNCSGDACIMLIGNCDYNNITYCTLIGSNVTESIGMVEGASYNTITENNLIGSGVNVFQSISETIYNNYWVSTNGSIQGSVLNEPVAIPLTGSNPLGASSPTPTVPEFPIQLLVVVILGFVITVSALIIVVKEKRGIPAEHTGDSLR
jgi:hypothetical protein